MKYTNKHGDEITLLVRPWAVEKPYYCENEKKIVIGKILITFEGAAKHENWEWIISKDEYLEIIKHDDYKPLKTYPDFGFPLDMLMLTPEEWEKTVEGQTD